MTVRNTLDNIVIPIRLGWHNFVLTGVALTMLSTNPDAIEKMAAYTAISAGIIMYCEGARAYVRTRNILKRRGRLDQRAVRPYMRYYCERQGARTATAYYGFVSQFDENRKSYKGYMKDSWIPHI